MTGKHQPITRFNGFNSLPLQFLFAAPNIPLKYQTDLAVANSKFLLPQSWKVQVLWVLCCSGTCQNWYLPIVGGFKCTSEKSFFPFKGKKKKNYSKTWQIWLWGLSSRPIASSLQAFFFSFLQWSKGDQNLTWVTRNKTVMAIKGVTRSNWHTPLPPTSNICASQKNKNNKSTKYNS